MSKRAVAAVLVLALCIMPAAAYYNVPDWAANSGVFSQAFESGCIPEPLEDADMSAYITRREFCGIAVLAYENLSGRNADSRLASPFTDADDPTINAAVSLGIVRGYADGTFRPENPVTREEIFKMLYNLLCCFGVQPSFTDGEINGLLASFPDTWRVQSWALEGAASAVSLNIVNGTSIDGAVMIDPRGLTTRAQAIVMAYRLSTSRAFNPSAVPGDVLTPGTALTSWGKDADTSLKWAYLMGSEDAPKYGSSSEAQANMVEITVDVWDFNSSGNKVATTRTFMIHYKLAATVMQIFKEIFEGSERFPIREVFGYAWRGNGTSEHNWGCAIDINSNENYYIKLSTGQTVGDYWLPGEDPYSIPADGDVVRIFHKYGFGWGGDGWWRSVRDYMHFSFMSN